MNLSTSLYSKSQWGKSLVFFIDKDLLPSQANISRTMCIPCCYTISTSEVVSLREQKSDRYAFHRNMVYISWNYLLERGSFYPCCHSHTYDPYNHISMKKDQTYYVYRVYVHTYIYTYVLPGNLFVPDVWFEINANELSHIFYSQSQSGKSLVLVRPLTFLSKSIQNYVYPLLLYHQHVRSSKSWENKRVMDMPGLVFHGNMVYISRNYLLGRCRFLSMLSKSFLDPFSLSLLFCVSREWWRHGENFPN
jgi:hypothetical protein